MKMTKSGRSVARNKPLKCVNLAVINLDVDKKYGSKNKQRFENRHYLSVR
jgi:hypothetical protein